ncbi:YifB family Mg chelatase-like AAA ATPase [Novosphingobium sp.]|uniref:YifB family Mg chelatase-like AAA ATPase n=1 Tax=Novosphingobium sp. TaxID=1874826 RepID=UPI0022C7480C|nr:YifB family Mg chelatase-like AAA ATPase [Novosphingobium sp.]MCZ8018261.1 YifB family Mg chelatase-like AAA ATPase [Novosphingobium sp.]MCZ8033255.1 YifB family Mg chelatase-like AAA ATPase [Novosphingobium sp.]MCZ8051710.1 YifB family Mg chelatase-like AAA ATPase [Novosphingobium sp.]MCZ8060252.1 YifB family Mg chelatase-like AAA ATPase [Novosphingobium sp.]MCZ8231894.1 YifB family Mg chelatase-like AAA ATPase [Novosphingobium sp.]
MVALVQTVAYLGLEARGVEVQCQIAPGLPRFNLVGLPDKAVNESRERVHAALAAMGLALPPKRITINLSLADLPKEGSHYDLPIALALLAAMGVTDAEQLGDFVAVGELALDGRVVASPGVLLAALHASSADKGLICPAAQGGEARWASGVPVLAAPDLVSLLNHLKGTTRLPEPQPGEVEAAAPGPDLKQVKGQEVAKRALEIAAAGGHNLLMIGPPGAGKSLMAACLPGILPPLSAAEALEVSMVASVAGTLEEGRISRARPFRSPHHSASMAALTGGGLRVKPGEVSLAHLGVLFLDELPEFQRAVLDSLRQPLETGVVDVARANAHVTFPARVQLVAAMNPCRCGYLGDPALGCSRAPRCGADYQAKVSGPMLDRIDLHVEVDPVSAADLALPPPAEGSAEVAARVAAARREQEQRLSGTGKRSNAELDGDLLERHATPDEAGRKLLMQAAEAMRLSARGYTRMLRVARTIADLAGSAGIGRIHVAEALSYRRVVGRS